jgi:ubiquinone/menaquinone biosynthesis C-methylase UbiE
MEPSMTDTVTNQDQTRSGVRDRYAAIAENSTVEQPEVPISAGGCCGGATPERRSLGVGYSEEELAAIPRAADMGLGCGNPTAIAGLADGEVVVDLGSGGGIDCFLAGQKVGPTGRVIGVDMTPVMISKARANAETVEATNVEFRLGEIEHLPIADASVDVVISNCVINLSTDKSQVYREIARILKPGGRLCVSDVLARSELPEDVKADVELRSCCVGGAETADTTTSQLQAAGFSPIRIQFKEESADYIKEWEPGSDATALVVSADIVATKAAPCCGPSCC